MRIDVFLEFKPGHNGRTMATRIRERSRTFVIYWQRGNDIRMRHKQYRAGRLRFVKRNDVWRVNIFNRGSADLVLGSFVGWLCRSYGDGLSALRIEFS